MADATTLFCLLESAAGYGLFEVVSMEEIASLTAESATSMSDLKRFGRAIKLKSFLGFESAASALENANAISEHAMTDTLRNFLEINLPSARSGSKHNKSSSGKTPAFSLGVIDPALATAISSGIGGISCRSDDTVREILRGCRLHLPIFVKGLSNDNDKKAQLGLGHSYSRSKVKFNPARSDNMIIQSIALLDQLDKDVNTFAMRVREWYSWHFPELKDLVKDNIMFARTAAYIQDKATLLSDPDKVAGLADILGGDPDTANAVLAAAKTSMGMDCSDVDMINIVNFTTRMVKLAEYRRQLSKYLSDKMNVVAPNLSALIGDTVAARLISKAGSLTNLAKSPASTVQILGAEKALFRALKSKGNTPKYGLIYHSTFIGRADAKNKGRISRYLANKCSIATRIDSFGDEPTRVYGDMLREQVEERLRFYETGQSPRKNLDVMLEAAKQVKDVDSADASSSKKKKRKADDAAEGNDVPHIDHDSDSDADDDKKKKKHKKKKDKGKEKDAMDVDSPSPEKKRKSKGGADNDDDDEDGIDKSAKKKKKRKSKGSD